MQGLKQCQHGKTSHAQDNQSAKKHIAHRMKSVRSKKVLNDVVNVTSTILSMGQDEKVCKNYMSVRKKSKTDWL